MPEEKTIIKGELYNIKKQRNMIIVFGGLFLFILSFVLQIVRIDGEGIQWVGSHLLWFIITCLCSSIPAMIWYFFLYKVSLTVTNTHVYGRAAFGKRVDLPLDKILSVRTCSFKGITITTEFSEISFCMIKNKDNIQKEISHLLINRQDIIKKSTTIHLIAGILFLLLAISGGFNYVNYTSYNEAEVSRLEEEIKQTKEEISEIEGTRYTYGEYSSQSEAQDAYDKDQNRLNQNQENLKEYEERLIEYKEFGGFGINNVGRLLLIIGSVVIAIMLFKKQKGIVISIGFAIVVLSQMIGLSEFTSDYPFALRASQILLLISYVFMAVLPHLKDKSKKTWFIPTVSCAISYIFILFNQMTAGGFGIQVIILNLLWGIIESVALLLTSLWIVFPNGIPSKQVNLKTNTKSVVPSETYCDLVKHILLLLFTFGIYYLIWIYRATAYLNCVDDEPPRNPTNKLLLCMFVPFYSIYWIYKSAQRIDRLAVSKGVASDITTLCIILAFFVGIIPPILMQEKMNTIANVENGTVTPQAHNATTTPKATIGAAEELKKYKELLDSGIISQSEFDAKKEQLLGL